jgi:hypothetical protein
VTVPAHLSDAIECPASPPPSFGASGAHGGKKAIEHHRLGHSQRKSLVGDARFKSLPVTATLLDMLTMVRM